MAGTTGVPRGCIRIRQTPRGGDGGSPGDEGDSLPGEGSPGRGQPPVRKRSEAPWRGVGGSSDEDPGDNGSPGGRRYPPRRGLPGEGRPPGPPGGGPPGPPGDPGPPGTQDPQVQLDHEDIEDLPAHQDLKDLQDHKVPQDKSLDNHMYQEINLPNK